MAGLETSLPSIQQLSYPELLKNSEILEETYYQVPQSLQGTTNPLPTAVKLGCPQWLYLPYSEAPLEKDPTRIIKAFDIVKVFVSDEDGNARNEYARVLDSRLLPTGIHLVLVCWYYSRKVATKTLKSYPDYLEEKWPRHSSFKQMLGCHYDVIQSRTIVDIVAGIKLNRFCRHSIWGGEKFNCRILSAVTLEADYEHEERNAKLEADLLKILLGGPDHEKDETMK